MDLEKAKIFAAKAHMGQQRKYTDEPYMTHPITVAKLVSTVTEDLHTIVAALLHDVLEDTNTNMEDIEFQFGERVAQLVLELTDISKPSDGNRSVRKEIDREHIRAASPAAKTIKLADLIDNAKTIVCNDPHFAMIFMEEMRALLEVLSEGDKYLYNIAKIKVDDYFSRN